MSDLPPPCPPSNDWALDLAHTMMASAIALNEAEDVWVEREVLRDTVLSLTGLLRDFPVAENDLTTLKRLGAALFDLANGVRSPLFTVREAGRPPSSGEQMRLRARAVCYVRLLKDQGVEANTSEEEVGKVLNKAGHVGHNGGPINRDLIHQWCENAAPGKRPEENYLVIYLMHQFRKSREDTLLCIRKSLAVDALIHRKGC